MGQCQNCNEFLYPELLLEVENTDDKLCVFCVQDTKEIMVKPSDGGPHEPLTKKDAVDSYKQFTIKIARSQNVRELVN